MVRINIYYDQFTHTYIPLCEEEENTSNGHNFDDGRSSWTFMGAIILSPQKTLQSPIGITA